MRRLLYILRFGILTVLAITQMACNDADNCKREEMAPVVSVMADDTVKVNTTHQVNIRFQVNNGCGSFKRLKEGKTGNKIHIEVEALYKGCMCTMNLPILNTDYEFTPKTVGTYVLKFGSGPTPDVVKQIEVIP